MVCKISLLYFLTSTKRICLSITNSIYNPLGLIQPIIVELKWLMGNIVSFSKSKHNLWWDDKLPEFMYRDWIRVVSEMKTISNLYLYRKLILLNAHEDF